MRIETAEMLCKDIVLSWVNLINADIKEYDGVYEISIPEEYSHVFMGKRFKRVTFNVDKAREYNCELVAPGNVILNNIIGELMKLGPVMKAELIQNDSIIGLNIKLCNGSIIENYKIPIERYAICLYYMVTIKSIKQRMEFRSIIVDIDRLSILEPRGDLVVNEFMFKPSKWNRDIDYKNIDRAYTLSVEELKNVVEDELGEFLDEINKRIEEEKKMIEERYKKRLEEISIGLENIKYKIKEEERKKRNAKKERSRLKYEQNIKKLEKRLEESRENASRQIERLGKEKGEEIKNIEKRYRPKVNYRLVSAILFRYTDYKYGVKFVSNAAEKELVLEYNTLYNRLSTPICDSCSSSSNTIYLCDNSHITCINCISWCIDCKDRYYCKDCNILSECYICRENICDSCKENCIICDSSICSNHKKSCSICDGPTCFFCSDTCNLCSAIICSQHSVVCSFCNNLVCKNDSLICSICSSNICVKHYLTCKSCNNSICSRDSSTCSICNLVVCKEHTIICTTHDHAVCNDDSVLCSICSSKVCSEHILICPICNGYICELHSLTCNTCKQRYCSSCITDSKNKEKVCNTCLNLKSYNNDEYIEILRSVSDKLTDKKLQWYVNENTQFIVLKHDSWMKHYIIVYDKSTNTIVHRDKRGIRAKW